jgi:transcriptional regulator with XRE-family HTH domain
MTIGGMLRNARIARRWTQLELSVRSGVSCSYIREIELGHRQIGQHAARRLHRVLPDFRPDMRSLRAAGGYRSIDGISRISVGVSSRALRLIDAFAERNNIRSRSEAVRRLIEITLLRMVPGDRRGRAEQNCVQQPHAGPRPE